MTKPIGILGGTFDPVHHGHLRLALEARDQAKLDHVRLVPLHTPPHREPPQASPGQRRAMLRLAVEGVDGLVPEDCELERGGVSYTIDTLEALRARLPEQPLCLITGMDAFARLDSWHRWQAIPETAHLILVERPGQTAAPPAAPVAALLERAVTADSSVLRQAPAGAVLRIGIPELDISATRLRALFAEGRDPRFLLPPAVVRYIQEQHLYGC
jgi:nicotinate-nucleotide adenylyltransferase